MFPSEKNAVTSKNLQFFPRRATSEQPTEPAGAIQSSIRAGNCSVRLFGTLCVIPSQHEILVLVRASFFYSLLEYNVLSAPDLLTRVLYFVPSTGFIIFFHKFFWNVQSLVRLAFLKTNSEVFPVCVAEIRAFISRRLCPLSELCRHTE